MSDKSPKTEIDFERYYRYKDLFDHPTEYEFYKILRDEILGKRYTVMIQVPLSSLIGVRNRKKLGWKAHFSKIARKRIDFVLCQIADMKPVLAIELDGTTHQKKSRQERDAFVDQLFESVDFPMLHFAVSSKYDKVRITHQIAGKLGLVKKSE